MALLPSNRTNTFQDFLGMFGDQYGFRTTSSIRSVDENNRVGGVWNSQHVSGTARDYSIKGKTPNQVQEFLKALQSSGLEAFTHDAGSGEHVHTELPPEGTAAIKCPEWMPDALCTGYDKITTMFPAIGPNMPGALARAVGLDDVAEGLDNWMWRISLVLFALILIAIAAYFVMRPAVSKATNKVMNSSEVQALSKLL